MSAKGFLVVIVCAVVTSVVTVLIFHALGLGGAAPIAGGVAGGIVGAMSGRQIASRT